MTFGCGGGTATAERLSTPSGRWKLPQTQRARFAGEPLRLGAAIHRTSRTRLVICSPRPTMPSSSPRSHRCRSPCASTSRSSSRSSATRSSASTPHSCSHEFLPALVERHFKQSTGDEYRVAVVSRRDPSHVLSTRPTWTMCPISCHGTMPRPTFSDCVPISSSSFGRPTGRCADQVHHRSERRRSLFFSMMVRRGPGNGPHPQATEGNKAFDSLLRWKLVARHRAGSLEAAVSAARHRGHCPQLRRAAAHGRHGGRARTDGASC